jgi:hypothetical protein
MSYPPAIVKGSAASALTRAAQAGALATQARPPSRAIVLDQTVLTAIIDAGIIRADGPETREEERAHGHQAR